MKINKSQLVNNHKVEETPIHIYMEKSILNYLLIKILS